MLALLAIAALAGPPIPTTPRPAASPRQTAEDRRERDRSAEAALQVRPTPTSTRPEPEAAAPDERERKLIVSQLFGDTPERRVEALQRLDGQRWRDAATVDEVLASTEAGITNLEGVLAALLYFERRDLVLLEPQAARLLVLLDEVSDNGPRTRIVSARLLGRLTGAERPDRRSAAQP